MVRGREIYYAPSEGHSSLQEQSLSKERRYGFNVRAIVVVGRPGSGQSSTAKALGEELGIPVYDTGQRFRELQREQVIDYSKRPEELDRELDEWQANLLRNATRENPIILTGKLAGFIADQVLKEETPEETANKGGIATVSTTCPRDVREQRIYIREKQKAVEALDRARQEAKEAQEKLEALRRSIKGSKLLTQERNRVLDKSNKILQAEERLKNITPASVRQNTRNRQIQDRKQWTAVHPELDFDPFDPYAKNKGGRKIYRHLVSSAKMERREVALEIIDQSLNEGQIYEISNDNPSVFPSQGTIFEAQ